MLPITWRELYAWRGRRAPLNRLSLLDSEEEEKEEGEEEEKEEEEEEEEEDDDDEGCVENRWYRRAGRSNTVQDAVDTPLPLSNKRTKW